MVAYSFKQQFEGPIVARIKRQTVRTVRKRNPRVGERIQLYVGLRTKQAHKIIPDPVCTAVHLIEIHVDPAHPEIIARIVIGYHVMSDYQIHRFARADGFGDVWPRRAMGEFWLKAHGAGEFNGIVVHWVDQ